MQGSCELSWAHRPDTGPPPPTHPLSAPATYGFPSACQGRTNYRSNVPAPTVCSPAVLAPPVTSSRVPALCWDPHDACGVWGGDGRGNPTSGIQPQGRRGLSPTSPSPPHPHTEQRARLSACRTTVAAAQALALKYSDDEQTTAAENILRTCNRRLQAELQA